jgi:hypothetical protein
MRLNHTIMGERVQLYRRLRSRYWQCATHLDNRKYRMSTGEEHRPRQADPRGLVSRSARQTQRRPAEGHKIRLRLHLVPFFGELGVSEVTAGKVQEYRVHRATIPPTGGKQPIKMTKDAAPVYKAPSRSTLHDEVVTLRLVLKTAIRHEWLDHLPDLSPPYRTEGKVVHRLMTLETMAPLSDDPFVKLPAVAA